MFNHHKSDIALRALDYNDDISLWLWHFNENAGFAPVTDKTLSTVYKKWLIRFSWILGAFCFNPGKVILKQVWRTRYQIVINVYADVYYSLIYKVEYAPLIGLLWIILIHDNLIWYTSHTISVVMHDNVSIISHRDAVLLVFDNGKLSFIEHYEKRFIWSCFSNKSLCLKMAFVVRGRLLQVNSV